MAPTIPAVPALRPRVLAASGDSEDSPSSVELAESESESSEPESESSESEPPVS